MLTTLVDTSTLARHLNDPSWVVVDCRFVLSDPEAGRRAYQAGHIPGARYAHLEEDLSGPVTPASGRHPLPDPDVLAGRLGRWAIDGTRQVVVYDDSFGAIAARLWWLLRWLGHPGCALLDGGIPKWQREGRPVTRELPAVKRVVFVPRVDPDLWVDSARIENWFRQGGTAKVLDARAEERYRGEVEPLDPVAGHIPGAVNAPYEDNLDFSGEFLAEEALREHYLALLGDTPPDQTIQMCGSGVTACHNILAMEHAGLPGAKLYAGSWSEWIRDARRPVMRED